MESFESKSSPLNSFNNTDHENSCEGSDTYRSDEIAFLSGENFQAGCQDVSYLCPYFGSIPGSITVTNFKLYYKSMSKVDVQLHFDVALCAIHRIEKFRGSTTKTDHSYGFDLICKDMRSLKFLFNPENNSRRDILEKLQLYAFPNSQKRLKLFAFECDERFPTNGWKIYDAVGELKRMGITTETWRITQMNERYELCESYPAILAVPATVADEELKNVANFRCKNRLPVLSWIHKQTQATITRTSQPQVGVSGKRSKDDELYLQSIIDANAESSKLYIMDARPSANAMANKARGGGTESEDAYNYADVIFLDIPNIHIIRESFKKVKDLCYPKIDENRFFINLEQTNWLKHIKLILGGAIKIAEKIIKHKSSVLVHCSDGWDRTPQLTSLAMILLDPFYRSIHGFEILIEKEWLSFGHKFHERIGHGEEETTKDRSPVFLQFIDCVFQIKNQFPNAFEFRDNFLIEILDQLYSCRFGTFLCNMEKERQQANLKQRTESLWSFMNDNSVLYRNPFYRERNEVIFPIANQRTIVLWKNYYFRWNPTFKKQDLVNEKCQQLLLMKEQLQKYLAERKQEQLMRTVSNIKV